MRILVLPTPKQTLVLVRGETVWLVLGGGGAAEVSAPGVAVAVSEGCASLNRLRRLLNLVWCTVESSHLVLVN